MAVVEQKRFSVDLNFFTFEFHLYLSGSCCQSMVTCDESTLQNSPSLSQEFILARIHFLAIRTEIVTHPDNEAAFSKLDSCHHSAVTKNTGFLSY